MLVSFFISFVEKKIIRHHPQLHLHPCLGRGCNQFRRRRQHRRVPTTVPSNTCLGRSSHRQPVGLTLRLGHIGTTLRPYQDHPNVPERPKYGNSRSSSRRHGTVPSLASHLPPSGPTRPGIFLRSYSTHPDRLVVPPKFRVVISKNSKKEEGLSIFKNCETDYVGEKFVYEKAEEETKSPKERKPNSITTTTTTTSRQDRTKYTKF
mmetsp:Transcript_52937/g.128402  ORF Transcript_52937/g.128402 Transcript_52937/m.128402 type:complete len:206 (+) Transcript_52937:283-900(+)